MGKIRNYLLQSLLWFVDFSQHVGKLMIYSPVFGILNHNNVSFLSRMSLVLQTARNTKRESKSLTPVVSFVCTKLLMMTFLHLV